MCKIEGCDANPVAKGLCAKHYMRARRQGSPDKTGKAGRPPSEVLAHWRKYLGEWSPRTLARFVKAMRMLDDASVSTQEAIQLTTRPNGSVNVSALLGWAEFVNSDEFKQALEIKEAKGVTIDQAIMEVVSKRWR
jgi:hypothetical protein